MTSPWPAAAAIYRAGGSLPPVPAPPYIYNATVDHFHDGDTGTLVIDLGFEVSFTTNIRLLGCNARELSMPGGKEARDYVNSLLPQGTQVVISSDKVDKYGGRYDATITFLNNGVPTDLVGLLVAEGWAAAWDGQGTQPVPPWPRVAAGSPMHGSSGE